MCCKVLYIISCMETKESPLKRALCSGEMSGFRLLLIARALKKGNEPGPQCIDLLVEVFDTHSFSNRACSRLSSSSRHARRVSSQ
jgi:hypothetical protein